MAKTPTAKRKPRGSCQTVTTAGALAPNVAPDGGPAGSHGHPFPKVAPRRTPAQNCPRWQASQAVVMLFEIPDRTVWRWLIWMAQGDCVSNLEAAFTGVPSGFARASPFHRKYLCGRPLSGCLCSPPEQREWNDLLSHA